MSLKFTILICLGLFQINNLAKCQEVNLKTNFAIENLNFYAITGDHLTLDSSSDYFIILKNNRSCFDCFLTVENYVHILSGDSINEWMMSMSDSSSLVRKRIVIESKNQFRKLSYYGVFYNKDFGDVYTPALILIKSGKKYSFDYKDLFNEGLEFIATKTQRKIDEILHSK